MSFSLISTVGAVAVLNLLFVSCLLVLRILNLTYIVLLQGYQQPVIKDWVVSEDGDATYKRIDYNLDEGTLMISLIDAETYQVIWKGYASRMLKNQNFKNNYFKGIVRSIFDQYPLMATTKE